MAVVDVPVSSPPEPSSHTSSRRLTAPIARTNVVPSVGVVNGKQPQRARLAGETAVGGRDQRDVGSVQSCLAAIPRFEIGRVDRPVGEQHVAGEPVAAGTAIHSDACLHRAAVHAAQEPRRLQLVVHEEGGLAPDTPGTADCLEVGAHHGVARKCLEKRRVRGPGREAWETTAVHDRARAPIHAGRPLTSAGLRPAGSSVPNDGSSALDEAPAARRED